MIRVFITLTCLFQLAVTVSGQQPPPAYEHLQPMEPFIGSWAGAFDPPGEMPAGTLKVTFRWIGDKSYVHQEVRFRSEQFPAGKWMNPENIIIGYDTDEQSARSWHFMYANQGRMTATIAPDRLVLHQQRGVKGSDETESQTKTMELVERDTLRIVETSRSGDDLEKASERTVILKRVESED